MLELARGLLLLPTLVRRIAFSRPLHARGYHDAFCGLHSMRNFDDAAGGHWQAALMEGSFGGVVLIFGRIGDEQVLMRPMHTEAANFGEAEQVLAKLDEAGLRTFLAEAKPWTQPG